MNPDSEDSNSLNMLQSFGLVLRNVLSRNDSGLPQKAVEMNQ